VLERAKSIKTNDNNVDDMSSGEGPNGADEIFPFSLQRQSTLSLRIYRFRVLSLLSDLNPLVNCHAEPLVSKETYTPYSGSIRI
jgi:hypothetical protein